MLATSDQRPGRLSHDQAMKKRVSLQRYGQPSKLVLKMMSSCRTS
jgi:hypothetical protein